MPVKICHATVICLVCCLILSAGCGPRFIEPHNPALSRPQLNENSFVSFDGTGLPLRAWLPAGGMAAAGAIIVAVHGFNDYGNFISRGAEFFASRSIAVYSYDQRGFGKAPVRGRWSSTAAMARDLETLIRLMARHYPDLPLFLLGHSMGGAVVIQAMAGENHSEVAGAILVAPAVWSRSLMPFYQTAALWFVAHTIPWYTVTGEILERKACSNIEALKELGRDPLVIKETRFDTIYGLQGLMDAAFANASNFRLKSLVLYGRQDQIIPKAPVIEAFKSFAAETPNQKQLILYENGFHMLLRDLEAETVMQDIVDWLYNRPLGGKSTGYRQ